jgi:hypothetical protein
MIARTMRVALDGLLTVYDVPHSAERWNGWAVPGLTLEQVRLLAADLAAFRDTMRGAGDPAATDQDTITIRDGGTA